MRASHRALCALTLLCSAFASAQVFVIPRHAGKAQVRHFDLDWRHVDLTPGTSGGGMRLYFYEREAKIAELAAASIGQAWQQLEADFGYSPKVKFEYFLYSSYPEFLQTNLFPLAEGVLGVTSPVDLKLTLPYLGDHRLFHEVGTHELAHEFTIQKAGTVAEAAQVNTALEKIPLWFIEGLAEYYAKAGMDPETELLVRDLMINPDPEQGHYFTDFFAEGPGTFLWIYKMGQARCAFLTETYGKEFLQRVLDASPRLVRGGADRVNDFPQLLESLTGDRREVIAQKFETWAKRGASKSFLEGSQDLSSFEPLPDLPENIDALAASPSGDLLLFRTFDPYTGQTRLYLADPRNPSNTQKVVSDSVPGYESLHPMFGRNFDLGPDRLAFVAESKGRDVLHVQLFSHRAKRRAPPPGPHGMVPPLLPSEEPDQWDISFNLGEREDYRFEREDLVAILAPSISPDGRAVAFIGLDGSGFRDVFVLRLDGSRALHRLTQDEAAERHLSWGPSGIIFNSDDTEQRQFNLFRVDPTRLDAGKVRLTAEARDHMDPRALGDGRIVFTAWEKGRLELYELKDGKIARKTDLSSGLFDPASGRSGGLYALVLHGGQRVPVRITAAQLRDDLDSRDAGAGEAAPELARTPLANAARYKALHPGNWELGPTFALLGGGTGGVAGSILSSANDRLRNHALVLSANFYGSFTLVDGIFLYLNQERRLTWGGGPFQELRFRYDDTFQDLPFSFVSGQRFLGGLATARYPLSTFARVEADLALGAISPFLLPYEEALLADGEFNQVGNLLPDWQARNRGAPFLGEVTGRAAHDTIRYHAFSGPIAGHSLLLEGTYGYQPSGRESYSNLRLDAAQYFPIIGRTRVALLGGGGVTFGGRLAREFYLSSPDTIRGVPFADTGWLLGRHYAFGTAELRVPLDAIIQIAFLSRIEAVAGFDAGGVADTFGGLWERRVVDFATGINLALGPLLARLHFARPFDVKAPAGMPVAEGAWVPQFTLRIVGLEGFFGFGPKQGADQDPERYWR